MKKRKLPQITFSRTLYLQNTWQAQKKIARAQRVAQRVAQKEFVASGVEWSFGVMQLACPRLFPTLAGMAGTVTVR